MSSKKFPPFTIRLLTWPIQYRLRFIKVSVFLIACLQSLQDAFSTVHCYSAWRSVCPCVEMWLPVIGNLPLVQWIRLRRHISSENDICKRLKSLLSFYISSSSNREDRFYYLNLHKETRLVLINILRISFFFSSS